MPIAVLMPTLEAAAIGERHVGAKARAILAADADEFLIYHPADRARDVAAEIESDRALVITDPLLIATSGLPRRLLAKLDRSTATAALPSANITQHALQRVTPSPFVTLRELTLAAAQLPDEIETVTWDRSDPIAYLCTTEFLDGVRHPLAEALAGEQVVISRGDFVHRWIEESSARLELLRLVPPGARTILEIGCGDGFLGETVKQRQKCRYVGVESSPHHAATARRHVDEIYRGDAEEIVGILNERFDCVIAGDAWQFTSEPWAFLAALRRVTAPGGSLVVSATNASHASLVADLLHGETPFVCSGSATAAAARPWTLSAMTHLVTSAGWNVAQPASVDGPRTAAQEELVTSLSGSSYSLEELKPLRHLILGIN